VLAPLVSEARETAAAALGASKFELEFAAGQQRERGAAIALALGDPAGVAAAGTDHADTAPLGNREAEAARLVAEGLTNKQIGARLFISERTVESHVRSILGKLGVRTRTELVAHLLAGNRSAPAGDPGHQP
jgi:DNA-binding NarL/FixJ family response regulator